MKKLLLVGSDSVHTRNYARLISGYFDDVLLLSNKSNPESGIRTIPVDFSLRNPLNQISSVRKIRKAIKEYQPTLIHIHQANSYAFYTLRAAKGLSIPILVTAWGSDILISPGSGLLLREMVKYNLRHANAFTSDSSYMADEMRKLVPEKKLDITIANFGIDEPVSSNSKENIIYSNRLHKKLYRIDKIIRAFKKFSDKGNSGWKLIIAATGEETENLKALSNELGLTDKVQFAGWLDKNQNAGFYAKAKIYVSIPESDATSISLLEAMAYGCIPVLSDIPANREWVNDRQNGLLIKDTDSDFISEALALDAEKVALQNKKLIQEKGTKEANRNKFIALYDKLLNKK